VGAICEHFTTFNNSSPLAWYFEMDVRSNSSLKPEESPFREALERFKCEHLKETESEQFQFVDLANLKSTIKEIQDEQASKNKMRNLTRLKAFLEGMEQYQKLIEMFVNASQYLAFVWVGFRVLWRLELDFCVIFLCLSNAFFVGSNEVLVTGHKQLRQCI